MDTFGRDLLRYGEIMSVNNIVKNNRYNTIRVIKYNDNLYKHCMIDGELIEIIKIV